MDYADTFLRVSTLCNEESSVSCGVSKEARTLLKYFQLPVYPMGYIASQDKRIPINTLAEACRKGAIPPDILTSWAVSTLNQVSDTERGDSMYIKDGVIYIPKGAIDKLQGWFAEAMNVLVHGPIEDLSDEDSLFIINSLNIIKIAFANPSKKSANAIDKQISQAESKGLQKYYGIFSKLMCPIPDLREMYKAFGLAIWWLNAVDVEGRPLVSVVSQNKIDSKALSEFVASLPNSQLEKVMGTA